MLGIDIGRYSIKLVSMTRQRQRWRMAGWVVHVSNRAENPDENAHFASSGNDLAAALSRLPRRSRIGRECAVLCLSSQEVMTRTFPVAPDLDDQDVENQVLVEADRHFPDSVRELSMDFCRLAPAAVDIGGTSDNDVLMVACRRERVESRCELMAGAGLRLAALEIDALAYWRLLQALGQTPAPDQTLILVDFGLAAFRLHVFHRDRLAYSRSHMVPVVANALNAARDVQRAVQLYQMSASHTGQMYMVLAGGVAEHSPGLPAALKGMCECPVQLLWQPSGINNVLPGICEGVEAPPSAVALACGLAMRQR